jgi:hypothetical protein
MSEKIPEKTCEFEYKACGTCKLCKESKLYEELQEYIDTHIQPRMDARYEQQLLERQQKEFEEKLSRNTMKALDNVIKEKLEEKPGFFQFVAALFGIVTTVISVLAQIAALYMMFTIAVDFSHTLAIIYSFSLPTEIATEFQKMRQENILAVYSQMIQESEIYEKYYEKYK